MITVIHDATGVIVGIEIHGTRYSPEALLGAAQEVERLQALYESAVRSRRTFRAAYRRALRVVRAAWAYQQARDAWMRDEIKGLAPAVLSEKEDALFAALNAFEATGKTPCAA
jgi:hypothetical protein